MVDSSAKFDPSQIPFDYSHLAKGEQNRINSGALYPNEIAALRNNQDPWAKFRGPNKNKCLDPLDEWKTAQRQIKEFKESERQAREIRELLKGGTTARPPKESETSTPPADLLAPGSLHNALLDIGKLVARFFAAISQPPQGSLPNDATKPMEDRAATHKTVPTEIFSNRAESGAIPSSAMVEFRYLVSRLRAVSAEVGSYLLEKEPLAALVTFALTGAVWHWLLQLFPNLSRRGFTLWQSFFLPSVSPSSFLASCATFGRTMNGLSSTKFLLDPGLL